MPRIRIKNIPKGFELQKKAKGGSTGDQVEYSLVTSPVSLSDGQVNTEGDTPTRKSLKSVPRDQANIEAEGGETVLTDLNNDGMFGLYNITGPSHDDGGVPMNLPDQSFIFSRDPSLYLTDEELAQFDMNPSKKGKSPAQVSKKYELNKYYGLIKDPYADDIQIRTAEMMMDKNMPELSKLAFVQESKKDFEDGVPLASFVYLQQQGVDPMKFKQEVEGITEQAAQAEMLSMLSPQQQQDLLTQAMFLQHMNQAEQQRQASQDLERDLQTQAAAQQQAPYSIPLAKYGMSVPSKNVDPQLAFNEEPSFFDNRMRDFMMRVDPNSQPMGQPSPPMRMAQPTQFVRYGFEMPTAQKGEEVQQSIVEDMGSGIEMSEYTISYQGMPESQKNVRYTRSDIMTAMKNGQLSDNIIITKVGIDSGYRPSEHPDFQVTDDLPMAQKGTEVAEPFEFDVSTGTTYVTGSSGERTGADAKTQVTALENQLDLYFQAIKDGTIQPNEDGTYDLPFTIAGGSSARNFKGSKAYGEISTALKELVQYYPELEGKIGFVQPDGSLSVDNTTGNVRLPQGFDNVFGETFDVSKTEDISLAGDNLNVVANQALAYDRNREAYETTFLPYLERAKDKYGLDIDASKFNVENTMSSYSSPEESASRLGLDYSKILAGDYSELSEKYNIDFTGSEKQMADQAENFLLDQAQFSTIGSTGTIPATPPEVPETPETPDVPDITTSGRPDEDFYIQDINDLKTMQAIEAGRRLGLPMAPPTPRDIDYRYALQSPQAQVSATNASLNAQRRGLRAFAGPQSYLARSQAMDQKGIEESAKIVDTVQRNNIGTINQGEKIKSDLDFRQDLVRTGALKKFFDETETALESFNNERLSDQFTMNQMMNNAITNRATTQVINSLQPYYRIDPTTGGTIDMFRTADLDPTVPSREDRIGEIIDISQQLGTAGITADLSDILKLTGIDDVEQPTEQDLTRQAYMNYPAPFVGQAFGQSPVQGRLGLEVGPADNSSFRVLPFSVGLTGF